MLCLKLKLFNNNLIIINPVIKINYVYVLSNVYSVKPTEEKRVVFVNSFVTNQYSCDSFVYILSVEGWVE